MSDIFISYSSKDRDRAKVLAGALESQGLSVWWDRKIPPGKQFSKVIKEAMDEAKCVIVLWSKESVKSEWVQNEASEGALRKVLVPALIDDVEIPFEFRRIQAARLVDWDGKSPHPEFDTLLEAVRAITGQPLSPQQDIEVPPRAACTITASAGDGGAISPSGEVSVNSGADQSFSITPEDGYQIADVVVDGNSVGAVASHTFTNVTADHMIDASFAAETYTITASGGDGGEINPSGEVTVNSGADQSFSMTPEDGYQIADVVVDGASVGAVASHTFTNVTADHTIDASFAAAAYTITSSAGAGGAISPFGEVTVNSGADQSFSITSEDGYQIADVVVDGTSIGAVASQTFTNVTADHTIDTSFAIKTYSLTANADDGSVTKSPDQASYNDGDEVTLEAVADSGYTFTGWSGDLTDSSNPAVLVMDADKAVTASFAANIPVHPKSMGVETQKEGSKRQKTKVLAAICIVVLIVIVSIAVFPKTKTYNLIATADPNGSISPSGKVIVNSGDDQSFSIKPEAGYQIADVVVDGASVGDVASHTFTNVTSNHTIDASFAVAVPTVTTYTITASADDGGEISPSGKVTVNSGDEKSFTIKPKASYQIADVVVDGNSVGAVVSHTFTKVTADHTIEASFTVAAHTITASAGAGGEISPSGEVSVNSGVDKTFAMTSEAGYKIADVLVDGVSIGAVASYTFTNVTANHTIDASFNGAVRPVTAYTITASAGAGGAISPSGEIPVNSGADQSFTMTPEVDYKIADVLVDGASIGAVASHTFTNVTADHTVDASFAITAYTITASAGAGGEISPSGKVLVNSGADKSFTMTAGADYKIADVLVDGNSVGAVASQTFTNVTADHTIEASFAALKAPVVITNSIGMKLVYIPAGEFMMGSSDTAIQLAGEYNISEEEFTDEFPQHKVRISKGFWMGQTEVTQGQYESVMNAQPWSGEPWVEEDANNPAVYVSWDKAVEFCRKLSQLEGKTYRLPTEAEWEYACRADTITRFSCGDRNSSLDDHSWFLGNKTEELLGCARAVGQKNPNPWGLYDMHGNVWEWCSDRYDKEYYSSSPSVDPKGPSSRTSPSRCLRGGSWLEPESVLRCSCRDGYDPDDVRNSVGFRVVCEE